MGFFRIQAGGLVAALMMTAAVAAHAQPAEESPSEGPPKTPAETLFDQGLDDMLAGRFDSGCPALAESFRLDPLPGVLFTLAECEHGWGKLASAQSHYRDYLERVSRMAPADKSKQAERAEVAKTKLDELEGRVPVLTIVVEQPAADARVTRNGETVASPLWGKPLPVDPGSQRIVYEAGGAQDEQVIELAEGANETVTFGAAATPLPTPTPTPVPGTTDGDGLHPMMVGAIVAGSVGLVGLLGGSIAGGIALSKKGTIDEQCVDRQCTPEGLDAVDQGQAAGTASTVLFVLGAVGAGAAVTLFLLAPDDEPSGGDTTVSLDLSAGPGGGSVGLALQF